MDKEHGIHHGADYFTDLGREVLQRLFEEGKRDRGLSDEERRIGDKRKRQIFEEAEAVGEYPPLLSSIPGQISVEVNGGPIKSKEDFSRAIRENPHVKSLIAEHHNQGRHLWANWESNKLKFTVISAAAVMTGIAGAGVYIRRKHHKK